MTQATHYTRTTGFADDERNNAGGRSTVTTADVDFELDEISQAVNLTIDNLALLQRDDGVMRDGAVPVSALGADTLKLLTGTGTVRGAWVTATSYAVKDLVTQGGNTYICAVVHVSGTFATDLSAIKWVLFQIGFNPSALAIPFSATANITSTNLQAALIEVDNNSRTRDTQAATDLADTVSASKNSGSIGFSYALSYAAGTIGKWLKDLATSTGGSFIKTIAVGTGAAARTIEDILRDFGLAKNFSVDTTGVADSATALTNFLTAGGGEIPHGSTINTISGITLDVSTAALRSKRTVWNCTSIAGAALSVYSSQSYPVNDRLNGTSVIQGIAFVGTNTAGSIGIQVGHASYTNNNEITFRDCSFSNFETLVKFITNAWRISFENCKFFNCNSSGSGFFLNFPNGISANAGEVMTFTNCTFYDPLTAGTDLYLYSGQWVFNNCSFGGGITRINSQGNAVITLNGCNLELQKNSATGFRLVWVKGTSTLNINGGTIVMNGGGTTWTWAPIQVDDTAVCCIHGLTLPNPSAQTTFSNDTLRNLIQGTSPYVAVRGLNFVPNVNLTYNFGVSSALNVLYNGDGSQTGTNGWTGAGLANNVGTGRSGNSLRVTGAASPYQIVTSGFTPGQACVMSIWVKVISGAGTVGTPRMIFLDRTGTYTVLTVGNIAVPSTATSYTNFVQICQVPAGTQQVWFVLDATGASVIDYDDCQLQFC